jgi:glycosyltransferase involved in cell wall biosynthesis
MEPTQHIAIILPGGIGTGRNNIGVPVLENFVLLLAKRYAVSVFQLHEVNNDYKAKELNLVAINAKSYSIKFLKFLFLFWRLNRKRKFIAVHGFWALPSGLLAVIAGKLFGIKSLVSLQGGDAISLPEIQYGQLRNPLSRRFVLWTLETADELISPSRFLIDKLRNHGLKRNDIKFIPLGVDTSLFQFRERLIGNHVNFLHIGNFNRVKDQQTLLKAFNLISREISCQLTIIGEGELEIDLRALVRKLGIEDKVIFQSPEMNNTLPRRYDAADVLLHTSLSEGHPIVVEEAMSCGVAVCGTRVGLIYDLQDCCVAVEVKDFESLAIATLSLLSDPRRLKQLREQAREWVNCHTIHWTIGEMVNVYSTPNEKY